MLENVQSWIVDTLARSEVLDLGFIISDLVDIPISEAELTESAFYDSLATYTAETVDGIFTGYRLFSKRIKNKGDGKL